MQNQHVADVGDFGKYGLLRALTGMFPVATPPAAAGRRGPQPFACIGRSRSTIRGTWSLRVCQSS